MMGTPSYYSPCPCLKQGRNSPWVPLPWVIHRQWGRGQGLPSSTQGQPLLEGIGEEQVSAVERNEFWVLRREAYLLQGLEKVPGRCYHGLLCPGREGQEGGIGGISCTMLFKCLDLPMGTGLGASNSYVLILNGIRRSLWPLSLNLLPKFP